MLFFGLFQAALAFDPDLATRHGPSLNLTWGGQATGGLDALFAPETLDRRAGGGGAESRWTAETAWGGFPAFSGRFTGSPHASLGAGARNYTFGWRLTPAAGAPDVPLQLRTTRWESEGAAPEHVLGVGLNARW